MGGNGKRRWKIFIYRSKSPKKKDPPREFLCPISGSLMSDPVVVTSGQTFERASVQACQELGFSPALPDGSAPDFSALIPNLALKSTILNWCATTGAEHPAPPDYASVKSAVVQLVAKDKGQSRASERELLEGVAEKPKMLFTHASTELNHRASHFYSSSSEESVIANVPASPLLSFATRPACYSSSSSSEILAEEAGNPDSTAEEQEIAAKLKSADVYEQEQGVMALRKVSRTNEAARVSLCTVRLMAALRPLLTSRYTAVQANAAASLVNLSLEKANKVRIVRSGAVPPLIDVLKGGCAESQEHAAGALFSLALEDDNKTAIGVLGALQPLLHALRSESERTRHDSALALYHLSLVQSNRVKLVKLGAASILLTTLRSAELAGRVLLVLCNLAACAEGKSAMLDSNAVDCLVGMLRRGSELASESTRENCVAALYALSHGSMRFKGLAKEARAAEVLREVEERGSDRAREKARRILVALRGRDEEVNWEGVLEGGASRTRHRVGVNAHGANSTEF
ncbi:hypothetical protein RJ639_034617 [Escallonia herrerae]|uniref:RING-type E3 ubiquitin transferase n=1 Tax=Escallonia herrerae TaxID=1293975 RepID=A0AA88WXG3_9ASTE|nr:hypothetical protein RJ639_034617 [Escallonia herrerae]